MWGSECSLRWYFSVFDHHVINNEPNLSSLPEMEQKIRHMAQNIKSSRMLVSPSLSFSDSSMNIFEQYPPLNCFVEGNMIMRCKHVTHVLTTSTLHTQQCYDSNYTQHCIYSFHYSRPTRHASSVEHCTHCNVLDTVLLQGKLRCFLFVAQ